MWNENERQWNVCKVNEPKYNTNDDEEWTLTKKNNIKMERFNWKYTRYIYVDCGVNTHRNRYSVVSTTGCTGTPTIFHKLFSTSKFVEVCGTSWESPCNDIYIVDILWNEQKWVLFYILFSLVLCLLYSIQCMLRVDVQSIVLSYIFILIFHYTTFFAFYSTLSLYRSYFVVGLCARQLYDWIDRLAFFLAILYI